MSERIGVYPGTFDPVTNGHMDIIQRGLKLVDRLVVAVAGNRAKGPMFTSEERVAMVEGELEQLRARGAQVEVRPFDNLLIRFVEQMEARIIIRGLRAVSDFEYEFQMAGMNARLDAEIETVFLMASDRNQFISSRFVKEIAKLDGDVTGFVSPRVLTALKAKLATGEAFSGTPIRLHNSG